MRIGKEVFSQGYVNALHQTITLPIIVLAAAALTCLWIKRLPAPAGPGPVSEEIRPEAPRATA